MKTLSTILISFALVFASCKNVSNVSEPEFRDIRDVRFMDVGWVNTTAGADMIYYNPNNFGIRLSSARGDVYVDNTYFGSFTLDQEVQVKKRAEFILPVTVKLDNINVFKNQENILKKKEALVRIEGIALVKKAGFSKELPIKYEHMQSIERLRGLVSK